MQHLKWVGSKSSDDSESETQTLGISRSYAWSVGELFGVPLLLNRDLLLLLLFQLVFREKNATHYESETFVCLIFC
jgi:hypothetical protein